jgi:ribosomal protein L21E
VIAIAQAYQKGDRVKLILDKERGPDTHLHGKTGEIINIEFDDASSVTGESEDNFIYTVQLDNGEIPDIYFRRHDLQRIGE